MTRLSFVLPCLVLVACAGESPIPQSSLMEGAGDVAGVKGLERLERAGVYESGATERFRVHVDDAQVSRLEWSASAGALSTSGRVAEWKLPTLSSAELSVRVVRRDGTEGTATWRFSISATVDTSRPMTAQAALLAMPMPVLDGGSLEVSGGACEVRYEGSTANVGIAFTTATHPSLMYGRWNGSAWSLEVVDAMGFNTGGVISQQVSMQVEPNGTPHLVYVREGTVMYATKSGGTWLRERVDATGALLATGATSGSSENVAPSIALSGTTPVILYLTGTTFQFYRPVIATRSGPSSWTRSTVVVPSLSTGDGQYSYGELVIDSSGRHLFPVAGYSVSTGSSSSLLVSWTSASTTSVQLPPLNTRGDTSLASGTRLLMRTESGLLDIALNATFSNTTMTSSSVELSGSQEGDVVWSPSQNRPVLLHLHGSSLELVTPNAGGFWTYTQLGTATSASAGLAVNPTTGETSLCYQANSRIMFQ
ncbi:MAG: hypothetical protein Q8L14_24215 [Myxococcales bacterium]|nr:hypothetical protein [Myxococcales bacterium]